MLSYGIIRTLHTISLTGGENGFILHGLLIFKSGSKTGHYHTEMNASNFTS